MHRGVLTCFLFFAQSKRMIHPSVHQVFAFKFMLSSRNKLKFALEIPPQTPPL